MTTSDKACDIPPIGWWCSRGSGHDGPCAATPFNPCDGRGESCIGCYDCNGRRERDENLVRGIRRELYEANCFIKALGRALDTKSVTEVQEDIRRWANRK